VSNRYAKAATRSMVVPRVARENAAVRELTGGQLRTVPLDQIDLNPHNPRQRMDPDALTELAETIRTYGLLEAPGVRFKRDGSERYEVVYGNRRIAAVRDILGWHEARVMIQELDDDRAYLLATIENIQRVNLTPGEEMDMLGVLLNMLKSQDEVARHLGKHPSWVSKRVRLLESARAAKAVRDREISVEQAYTVLSRAADDAEVAREIDRITAHGETLHETRSRLAGKRQAATAPNSPSVGRKGRASRQEATRVERATRSLSFDQLPHLSAILGTIVPNLTDELRRDLLHAIEADLTDLTGV